MAQDPAVRGELIGAMASMLHDGPWDDEMAVKLLCRYVMDNGNLAAPARLVAKRWIQNAKQRDETDRGWEWESGTYDFGDAS